MAEDSMIGLALFSVVAMAGDTVAATPPVASEMHTRFELATRARDGVVAGDLDAVRAAGRELADLEPPAGLPEPWRPWVAEVKVKAESLARSADLVKASGHVANLTLACAACHQAMDGGPSLKDGDVPAQTWRPGDNMALHSWSSNWMWLGLITGDEGVWVKGAKELSSAPLVPRFEGEAEALKAKEQVLYSLADKATKPLSESERAELYGAFIGACSGCHSTERPPAPAQ
jgi:cytochrome c553